MRKQKEEPLDLLQGTLDLLILRTLPFGPIHGQAIAKSMERASLDVLRVEHGSLYPALYSDWSGAAWSPLGGAFRETTAAPGTIA
jgi:PadR family transcriptional regulator, regulatory protein PadR